MEKSRRAPCRKDSRGGDAVFLRALRHLAFPAVVTAALMLVSAGSGRAASGVPAMSERARIYQTSAASITDSVEWLRVTADSGVVLAAVARPEGAGPFPVIVILHGTHGFGEEYVRFARDMARNGFVSVAACWFAGGHGAGTRVITPIDCPQAPPFVDAQGSDRFRVARQSIDALVRAVRGLPYAQGNRIALWGHSRGGGAALDYLLSHPGSVQAVVLNSTGYPGDVTRRVSEIKVPVLIMHGTDDRPEDGGSPVTNVEMARRFEVALRGAGKRVEARYYEGGHHNSFFSDTMQYRDALKRTETFLRGSLRPGAETPNRPALRPNNAKFDDLKLRDESQ